MAELFQQIEDRKEEIKVEVAVTFLEIYNEEIRDLLAERGANLPKGGLVIREDKTVKVANLTELRPTSAEEVKQIVLSGNARRTQSPTHANETSSRSHAALQVHLTTSPRTADTTELHKIATLSIIDLAGSERASATKNMGERMVEGANINKSLLALGNCINALCEAGVRKAHVPYRNSKLTRLLKFSLGGNCKTVMIVCVAPASNHFEDTHNTLVYAERAKKIKMKGVTANFLNVDRHVGQYVEAINRLTAEVAELKAKLSGKAGIEAEISKRKKLEAKTEVERAKSDMESRFEQSRAFILDGASSHAALTIAELKHGCIRRRLAQIDRKAEEGPLSSDMTAERDLLQSLVKNEEQILSANSTIRSRIRASSNTSNLFEAMMRAVCERKQDKLDEVFVDNVALDAKAKRAYMAQLRAEAEASMFKSVVGQQAELLVNFTGILARYAVMLKDGSQTLSKAANCPDTLETVARTVAADLTQLAEANDTVFEGLIGHSTSTYMGSFGQSSLSSFSSHILPIQTAPIAGSGAPSRRSLRRLSNQPAGSPRRMKTPRKASAMRTNLTAGRKAGDREKKNLRWKDEAGQGDLEDTGSSIIFTSDSNASQHTSVAGSESDWEDMKPDEALPDSSLNVSITSSDISSATIRRPRSNRLDRGFLISGKESMVLVSLNENEPTVAKRRSNPLSDRSNQMEQSTPESFNLILPKGKSASITPRMPTTITRTSRRRSQIGPIRSEKTSRRRSSLIPQLSPPNGMAPPYGGARRVPIDSMRSPAKRVSRVSLSKANALRPSIVQTSFMDQNVSITMPAPKPSWK